MADPSPEGWNRVRLYASWMREVNSDDWFVLEEGTLLKLRLNSPAGGWFPALQKLRWIFTESNLPYADLFFSPQLRKIYINTALVEGTRVPRDILPTVASAIATLPTSTLQSLRVEVGRDGPRTHFKDSFSSLVLRCGPSLTKFTRPAPLSDAAINHLVHLPHLCCWGINDPPPNYSAPSLPLPLSFPPLTQFVLGGGAGRGWISLLARLAAGVTPLSKTRESLETLNIAGLPNPIIDVSFVSPIQMFHNLAFLNVVASCYDDRCAFELNNDNVAELAKALPHLSFLCLGHPCSKSTCATTIACLLPISCCCLELESLEIHFNTAKIVEDFKSVSTDPQFERLRSLPKCSLSRLELWQAPLALDEHGIETVANGMVIVFPLLECCIGLGKVWGEVSSRISEFRKI